MIACRTDGNSAPDASNASLDLSPVLNDVQIIVEPSDNAAGLIAAINAATKSVHMTMYLLSNNDIIKALGARQKAGVDVKVVLNQNFPDTSSSNIDVYKQLQRRGVPVAWAPAQFTYTHEKCVILDGATAWIMTMNATQTSATQNREYLAIDTRPADVAEAEAIFAADFAGTTWTPGPTDALLVSPINSSSGIDALLNTATTTIDLEGEELSDQHVVASLTARADAGVAVRIVVATESSSTAQLLAISTLKQHGIPVVAVDTPTIHAKAFVIDGATAFIGSENFTSVSLDQNRELGLFFMNQNEVIKVATTIAADFAIGTAQ